MDSKQLAMAVRSYNEALNAAQNPEDIFKPSLLWLLAACAYQLALMNEREAAMPKPRWTSESISEAVSGVNK